MEQIFERILQLPDLNDQTVFLWGPRKTGKSSWIKAKLAPNNYIDLLKSDVFAEYATRPALLRERYTTPTLHPGPVVIDEIQKIPALLDEVHWLIENANRNFLLTGSSARKLRRQHANLLGGRAWRREMRPLCFQENKDLDIERALISGLLPSHYLSSNPTEDLNAYIADYLKEEIAQEAEVQNLPAFSDFLRVAAITSGELLNYTNVGSEVGVSAKVVRSYFQILEDTLLGFRIQPWSKSVHRRLVETEKFYLFDVGVSNFLARRKPQPKTPEFGKSFEHFILMELLALKAYKNPQLEVRFWRTLDKKEVDFVVNDKELVIEVKSSNMVKQDDLKNLKLISEDQQIKYRVVVCDERQARVVNDSYGSIQILPWREFLEKLWADEFGV